MVAAEVKLVGLVGNSGAAEEPLPAELVGAKEPVDVIELLVLLLLSARPGRSTWS